MLVSFQHHAGYIYKYIYMVAPWISRVWQINPKLKFCQLTLEVQNPLHFKPNEKMRLIIFLLLSDSLVIY